MKQFIVLVILFFSGVQAFADDHYDADDRYDYQQIYSSDVKYDDGISYDTLVEKIKTNGVQTLEATLELVPKQFYENYVLVYRSRSLQDSSPLFPRAIVFGRSSKFIMAYNGHKKQKGYNNLEMIQYREKEFRWEFREITYIDGKAPVFSEANPKKCLECHQSPKRATVDPRPNWEPYNFWPGVYASVDSKIDPVLKKEYDDYKSGKTSYLLNDVIRRFLPQDYMLMDEQALERTNLDKFFATVQPTHDRYKHLGKFSVRSPLNFTKSTVILNMYRVARLIRQDLGELFDIYKYALLGIGDYINPQSSTFYRYRCHALYMPESVRQKHIYSALQKKQINESHYQKSEKPSHFEQPVGAALDILLMPLGVLTDDLSMDFRTDGRFSFEDRFTSPHNSATHFREAVMAVYAGDPAVEMDCDQLREASDKALTQFETNGGLMAAFAKTEIVPPQSSKPIVSRCISCHVNYEDGGQAPHIPFDDFSKLKPLLSEKKYPRGTLFEEIQYRTGDHAPLKDQMPPAGIVDRSQRDVLIRELEALMK